MVCKDEQACFDTPSHQTFHNYRQETESCYKVSHRPHVHISHSAYARILCANAVISHSAHTLLLKLHILSISIAINI